ncbi:MULTISPECIES: helix-turn-helix transcriptional regulator [Bifidobacterium]|uniref:helix-turn-helix transcriptional regulator n=1 Tax=Bifidobacterium TaxID=1678 RepID=UPI001BDC04C5|nr:MULTISPECIES: transcriptional regulator [Bifidobacterium]MBT1162597.1 transcriptional regulator [Bifidobacterium sp. SO1]MBW3079684.1 transcriptional regulator [Bifidobacterium simiiventris]
MPASPNISPELKPYAALVDFLGVALGRNTEVVLQDCRDFEHSIVAIANGHVSGRSLGGPATDLILRVWRNREYERRDYITRYTGTTADGRELVSSTFFIRDEDGDAIGTLCINHDASTLVGAVHAVAQLFDYLAPAMPKGFGAAVRRSTLAGDAAGAEADGAADAAADAKTADGTADANGTETGAHGEGGGSGDAGTVGQTDRAAGHDGHEPGCRCCACDPGAGSAAGPAGAAASHARLSAPIENFSVNAEDLTISRITAFCANAGVEPERMSRDERLALIRELEDAGVFTLKGAVDTVAERLGVSQPSVYRYLKQVRAGAE